MAHLGTLIFRDTHKKILRDLSLDLYSAFCLYHVRLKTSYLKK